MVDVYLVFGYNVKLANGVAVRPDMLLLGFICVYGRLNVCTRDTVQRPTIDANISDPH